jgi:OPT oligopeptide transporter protein
MNLPASARDESVVEFTLRAALAGIIFGLLFGAANAYLGLRVGLTVSTSIPIAVLTVALFRAIGEGLAGVAIAFLVAAKTRWPDSGWSRWLDTWHFAGKDFAWITGSAGVVLGIVLVLGVAALLYRVGRSGEVVGLDDAGKPRTATNAGPGRSSVPSVAAGLRARRTTSPIPTLSSNSFLGEIDTATSPRNRRAQPRRDSRRCTGESVRAHPHCE